MNQFDLATGTLQRAIGVGGVDVENWYLRLAEIYSAHGDADLALANVESAKKIDSSDLPLRVQAEALREAARFDDSIAVWQQALKLHKDCESYWGLGVTYESQMRYAEAIPMLQQAVSMGGDCSGAAEELVRALAYDGRETEAVANLEKLFDTDPKPDIDYWILADAYGVLGKPERAPLRARPRSWWQHLCRQPGGRGVGATLGVAQDVLEINPSSGTVTVFIKDSGTPTGNGFSSYPGPEAKYLQFIQNCTGATNAFVEVCKSSSITDPVTGDFTFTSPGFTGLPNSSVTVPVGACSPPIPVSATAPSSTITITETAQPNVGVNAITATGYDPVSLQNENRLDPSNPPSLANGTASVVVVPGDVSTQTIVDFTNFAVPHGVLEVCKYAAQGTSVSGVFQFTVSGSVYSSASNALSVPVGACSGPVLVHAGAVTVTELPTAGSQLVEVQTNPLDSLASVNVPGGSAVVTVLAGDVSTETVVSFTNSPAAAQLKICKIGSTGVATGQYFNITANGVTYPVPAGPASQGGSCVFAGTFPVGVQVMLTETPSPTAAYKLINITVNPPEANSTAPDLANGTVTVTTSPSFTEVTFTNIAPTTVNTGQLKICKIAGAQSLAGLMFEFNVVVAGSNQTYPSVFVPAGPGPGGYCVVDASTFPISTAVTVTEASLPGTTVTSIAVTPTVGGPCAPASPNCEVVTISSGITEVDFTNNTTSTTPGPIITTSLPTGLLSTAYAGTAVATGGRPPYSWTATGLPPGLSINPSTGAISGTPTTVVTTTVTFTVTDSSTPSLVARASSTLTIIAPLTITTTSLSNGVAGTPYSQTLTAIGGTAPYTWQLTAGTLPAGLTLNPSLHAA
jgi:hypothetical protein